MGLQGLRQVVKTALHKKNLFFKKGCLNDLAQATVAHYLYPHIHTDPTARSRAGKLREPGGIEPAATDSPVRHATD